MRYQWIIQFAVLAFIFGPAGCDGDSATTQSSQGQTGLATMHARLGSRDFTLEIADTDPKRETGLMYRTSMAKDHGMIFVFPDSQVRQFYMANTKIPLDIAFIGSSSEVVSIKSMQPLDLRITSSDSPAKYAIEMDQGEAATIGLKVGDRLDLQQVATTQP